MGMRVRRHTEVEVETPWPRWLAAGHPASHVVMAAGRDEDGEL